MNGTVTPEMLANRQDNAADFAGWFATQSTKFGSAATAYGTYLASQPNAVSQTGAAIQFGMAGTATVVGFGASALEQLLRPNVGQTVAEGAVNVVTGAFAEKFRLAGPAINEFGNIVTQSGVAESAKDAINAYLNTYFNNKGDKK